MPEDENDNDAPPSIESNEDGIEEQDQDVEYTGRENPWDLVMWGITKARPNLAKTAEVARLAIAKPLEFVGNGVHKVYEALETLLIDKEKDFLGPFAIILGAVVKGMLTGNETESRLDKFETITKTRKISDVVNDIANDFKKIPEKEVKQNLEKLTELVNDNIKIQPNTYATVLHSKNSTKGTLEKSQEVKKGQSIEAGDHVKALLESNHEAPHFSNDI